MQVSFDNLIDLAIRENVLFVVFSGDIYDNAEAQEAQQGRFRRGLERLAENGIKVFIALGNHDPYIQNLNLRRPYPDTVTIFRVDTPEEFTVWAEDGVEIRVAGVSFREKHEKQNLAAKFSELPKDSGVVRIGVLHTNVTDGPSAGDHDPYAPCTVADLTAAPVHYWALGHIHLRSVNRIDSDRWWAYPGNLQGRNFKPAECHPKGALLIPFTESGVGEPEFVACDTVRFVEIIVDASEADSIQDLQERIVAETVKKMSDIDDRRLIARVRLVGSTDLHLEIARSTGRSHTLLDQIVDSWGSELGQTLIAGISANTSIPIDPAGARKGDTLLAASLRRLDDLSDEDLIKMAPDLVTGVLQKYCQLDSTSVAVLRSRIERALIDTMAYGGS